MANTCPSCNAPIASQEAGVTPVVCSACGQPLHVDASPETPDAAREATAEGSPPAEMDAASAPPTDGPPQVSGPEAPEVAPSPEVAEPELLEVEPGPVPGEVEPPAAEAGDPEARPPPLPPRGAPAAKAPAATPTADAAATPKVTTSTGASKAPEPSPGPERRRYVRIPTVVPVNYQLVSKSGGPLDAEVRTGFTQDLSESGLCLQTGALPAAVAARLETSELGDFGVYVDITTLERRLRIPGRLVWRQSLRHPAAKQFVIGIEYTKIEPEDAAAIWRFAKRAARRPKLFAATIGGLFLVALAAIGLFLWSSLERERALGALRAELRQRMAQREEIAASLERQTSELDSVSKLMREVVAAQQEAMAAGEDVVFGEEMFGELAGPGDGEAGSTIESLRTDIETLRGAISTLSTRVQELRSRQEAKKKGRRPGGGKR